MKLTEGMDHIESIIDEAAGNTSFTDGDSESQVLPTPISPVVVVEEYSDSKGTANTVDSDMMNDQETKDHLE